MSAPALMLQPGKGICILWTPSFVTLLQWIIVMQGIHRTFVNVGLWSRLRLNLFYNSKLAVSHLNCRRPNHQQVLYFLCCKHFHSHDSLWLLHVACTILLYDPTWLSVSRLNCCWPSPAQSFLASVSLRSMTKIFILSQTSMCFEMGPPLQWTRGRSFYVGTTFFLHHNFSMSIYMLSWLLWTLCTLCHCTTLSNVMQTIQRFPVNEGLCRRLCLNLCNYSETAFSQLNGRRPDRRQV
jgi:hypothetical protein